MTLSESVERIVVEALEKQDDYACDRYGHGRVLEGLDDVVLTEPDSGEVTRELFEAFANALEEEDFLLAPRWLRSQIGER